MKTIKTVKYILICSLILIAVTVPRGLFSAGYYEQGRTYYIYKQYDKAREMFLKRIELGDHGDAYYFLGEIEKNNGNYDEAEDYFKKSISIATTTPKYKKNAYWNIIVLAEGRGNYSDVVLICKNMWNDIHDESAKAKIESIINKYLWSDNKEAIEMYKTGIQHKESGNIEQALTEFRNALYNDSSFLAPKFEIGMYYYKNGDFESAAWYLGDIAYRIPFYAEVQLLMGNLQFQKGYYSSALDFYNKSLKYGIIGSSTEYTILIKTATIYYRQGYYDKALEKVTDALGMRKRSAEALLLQSAIFIKQEDYDQALKTLRQAEAVQPKNSAILFQIGSIYYKNNDWRYLSYFDRLYGLTKDSDEKEKFLRILPILVRGHYEKNHYDKTTEIISSMPGYMIDYNMRLTLAKSYYHLDKFDKAIDEFEKISLERDDELLLCKAYARSGREAQAREMLSRFAHYDDFMEKAKSDTYLARILHKIDQERKEEERREQEELKRRQEEEKQRELERQKQLEAEKLRELELRKQMEAEKQHELENRIDRENDKHHEPEKKAETGETTTGNVETPETGDSTGIESATEKKPLEQQPADALTTPKQ